ISLGGILIRLWDTAGLEKQGYEPDPIEKIGIEMGWKKVAQSDLVLYVHDSTTPFDPTSEPFARVAREAGRVLIVANKCDQPQSIPIQSEQRQTISLSALTNRGLDDLRMIIPAILLDAKVLGEGRLLITTERHREALASASAALSDASRDIEQGQPAEIVALSIRSALHALNDIIGITTTEDILGLIFSKFCIGK
ncbi:MAG: tRNA uridine-5-carboxymethylaminomethyl(34) synthesis GTPase MnmE, partial [Deltaproteobacteria bacterium]|nr:tRNA uridine-5-carboxymethylaminomethyl(34) synthesis GTPase MnmE [Deltaproteobacteria bacterium]